MNCLNCPITLSEESASNKRKIKVIKTALVIPAFNEEGRISTVLEASFQAKMIDEIIVVDDGSTDNTCEEASRFDFVKVIRLNKNMGKAAAMIAGAKNTIADVILFLDADLIGLDGKKIDSLVEPVILGKADVSIGLFKNGRSVTDLAQFLAPYISGQRAIRKDIFLNIPNIENVRSGIESAITKYCKSNGLTTQRVELSGCTHWMKEEKRGKLKGFACRLIMYFEILKVILDDGIKK